MPLNVKTPILPLVLMIFLVIVLAPTTAAAKNASPSAGLNTASSTNDALIDVSQLVDAEAFHAEYRGHIQNIGDIDAWTIGPNQFGTMGRSLRIEGFMIKLIGDVPADMHIKYTVHVQNKAWLYPVDDDSTWPTDGAFAGTRGESLRLEAVHIKLVDENGNLYPDYSVYYRGHVENEGDIDWVKNNGELGSTGKSQRLEALEIKIVKDIPDIPKVPDSDLSAYLAAIAAYQDKTDLYTTESWSVYQTVLGENVMSVKNSQKEVDATTQLIIDAQKQLVLKSSGGGSSGGGGGWTPPVVPTPTIKKEVDVINATNGTDFIDVITPATSSDSLVIQMSASSLFSVSNLQELLGTMGTKKLHKASLTANSSEEEYQLSNVLFYCNHPELILNEKNASGQFMAPDGLIRLSALANDLQFTFYRTDVTVFSVTTGIEKSYQDINMQNNVVSIQIDAKTIAEKSVKKAEETKLPTDLTTAKGWVDQLPDGDDKNSLHTRINVVAKANLQDAVFTELIIPENTDSDKLAVVTNRIKTLIGSVNYTLTPSDNNYTIKLTSSTPSQELTLTTTFLQTINLKDIGGVTVPELEGTPVTAITETDQYAGTVNWKDAENQAPVQYEDGKHYTATITLTPETVADGGNLVGYTLTGVPENYFTVAGTETPATNLAQSGIVTTLFPTVIDPVEIAVKAAENGRINKDSNLFTLLTNAQNLVTPLGDGPRKQGFQARLDVLNTEASLDSLIALIRINRSFSDENYYGIGGYYLPRAMSSINSLADGPLKASLQDRLAVVKTVLGLIDQEYNQSAFYQFELLRVDDAHKLAAIQPVIQQILADDGNDCLALTVKGDPWASDPDLGGNMTFDTFDVTITRGHASIVYSLLVREFFTPDFDTTLENSDPKSAGTSFNVLITGFKDEQGAPLNGSRKVIYYCLGDSPDGTPSLLVEQTLTFTDGTATLPVTLPSDTETFDFSTWNQWLYVRIENSTLTKYLSITTRTR